MTVRASTECLITRGERFIFHVSGKNSAARFIADFNMVDGLELIRSMNVRFDEDSQASVIEVPEATFSFKMVSQLEYDEPKEEMRRLIDGWVVQVKDEKGKCNNAYLSDVSENGAGILSNCVFQRGQKVTLHLEAAMRSLEVEADVRYCVKSKIAPDMFKSGLKLHDFGRLEGAVWRNFLKAA